VATPAIISMTMWNHSEPPENACRSVSGRKLADCTDAASGIPSPSFRFHHGTWPWSHARAAAWPIACELYPTLGSMNGCPGMNPLRAITPRPDVLSSGW